MAHVGNQVLVVEDEWLLAEAMTHDITAEGYQVIGPVGTVGHALALLETEKVSAAILDYSLGGSTSFPIARALRARNIPFCFMSGYMREQLPEEFNDVPLFVKPCEGHVLRQQVRALFSKAH